MGTTSSSIEIGTSMTVVTGLFRACLTAFWNSGIVWTR